MRPLLILAALATCLLGCAHSNEARAAEAGTMTLDMASEVRPKVADWIVKRKPAIPIEAESACHNEPPPTFVVCYDREVAERLSPVTKADIAHASYNAALDAAKAGQTKDLLPAATALLGVARAAGLIP